MTVIAWDGKIIAADKQATRGGQLRKTTKLIVHPEKPIVYGMSGTEQTGIIVANWHIAGAKEEDFPECQKIVGNTDPNYWSHLIVCTKNSCEYYSMWPVPLRIRENFYAIGSGDEYAMGAMEMGANAIKAVEVACKWDQGCGLGIDAYNLETMEKVL